MRTERKAQNQAAFREVNEHIAELASHFERNGLETFVCECSRVGCTQLMPLALHAYAEARDSPATFLVLAGHEDLEHEEIVADRGSYLIVREKPGFAERLARKATRLRRAVEARRPAK